MSQEAPSLHERLVESLRTGSSESAYLARERMEELMPVCQQMEAVVGEGEAAPEFMRGARLALEGVQGYIQVLTTPARSVDGLVEALDCAQARMVASQEELAQAHERALAALPLKMVRTPHNLQQLRQLLLGWMQGLADRGQVEEVFATLLSIYGSAWQQLGDADAISSQWEPEHQKHLGEIMRKLDDGYRTGTEALEMLGQVRNSAGVAALWPALVQSFVLVQSAADDIEELEESVGSLDILEGLTSFAGSGTQRPGRWLA